MRLRRAECLGSRVGHVDAEENELGDWLPELEAFLDSIEFTG